jgi:hypothetical protein
MNALNRLLGLLLGLALLAAAGILVVETVIAAMDRPGWLVDRQELDGLLRGLMWEDRGLVLTGALVVLAGLVLLAVQFWPGTPARIPVAQDDPNRRAGIEGRGMQELLRRRAMEDEDVLGASARVRRRTAQVTVDVPGDADGRELKTRVRQALRERIDELRLEKRLRTKVVVRRAKERVR